MDHFMLRFTRGLALLLLLSASPPKPPSVVHLAPKTQQLTQALMFASLPPLHTLYLIPTHWRLYSGVPELLQSWQDPYLTHLSSPHKSVLFSPEFHIPVDPLISNWNHAEFFPFPATPWGIMGHCGQLCLLNISSFSLTLLIQVSHSWFLAQIVFFSVLEGFFCPQHSHYFPSVVSPPSQPLSTLCLPYLSSTELWSWCISSWVSSCSWWLPQGIKSHLVPTCLSSLIF